MTTDRFLFREGYALSEQISRIPTAIIDAETPEISRRLTDLSLTEQEIGRMGKSDFFEEANENLSEAAYQSLVSDLFTNYGVQGDKFNVQLFVAEQELSLGDLASIADEYVEERLDHDFDSLTEPIVLTDFNMDTEFIDFQFRTTARLEDINPDDKIPIQIINTESGKTVERYGSEYQIKAPARYHVEARVYPETGIIAVSNYSKIKDGLKSSIAATVAEMDRGAGSGVGKTHRLDMNETELLLLRREMEGDISGLGYTLEIVGLDKADFTGRRDEDIVDTTPVQAADEAGQIRKIKFYVDHPEATADSERDVMLRIFDDGHLTTSKPVPSGLLNAAVEQIHAIRAYNKYLTPMSELIYSYVRAKFKGQSTPMMNAHISKTNLAFNNLIEEYFDRDETPTEELRLYKSMIANIGIRMCEEGIPRAAGVDGVDEVDDFYELEGKIEEFFRDYSERTLGVRGIDYDELSNHLDHLLRQDWESPIEIIEHAIDLYDLSR